MQNNRNEAINDTMLKLKQYCTEDYVDILGVINSSKVSTVSSQTSAWRQMKQGFNLIQPF